MSVGTVFGKLLFASLRKRLLNFGNFNFVKQQQKEERKKDGGKNAVLKNDQ